MTDRSAPQGGGWSSGPGNDGGSAWDDDGWGPSTAVRSGSSARPYGEPKGAKQPAEATPYQPYQPAAAEPTQQVGANQDPGSTRAFETPWNAGGPVRTATPPQVAAAAPGAAPKAPERGLPWWGALLVLIVIAIVGGLIDTFASNTQRGGFNIGIVVASVAAILLVRRSHMFPVVIAPPIIYSIAAVLQLYVRSGGLHDKKVVFDAAANYLVYGFPAIAAATAAVLIIAGIRMITRR